MRRRIAFGLGLLLLGAAPVAAQPPPVNPTVFGFDHTDYAATTDYEFGFFVDATAIAPVQTTVVPKPATACPCTTTLASRPAAFQIWWTAVRARVGTAPPYALSDWSNRISFERRLAAPTSLVAK